MQRKARREVPGPKPSVLIDGGSKFRFDPLPSGLNRSDYVPGSPLERQVLLFRERS